MIGARRVRQGLGPYVVRHLQALGVEVPCFLASRPESIPETERETGARGYDDVGRMLREQALDALAICSPAASHEAYLEAALEARLHVLCEKPLVWGGGGLAARARRLEQAFGEAGLGLRECCQWPETLPAYRALHGDPGPVRSFAMRLSPSTREPRDMLGDSLSHPLSLLQALAPGATRVAEVKFPRLAPGAVEVTFDVLGEGERVASRVELATQAEPPRIAGFGVNGAWAERRIRPDDYALRFVDGERAVAVPDPLQALLAAWVQAPSRPADGSIGVRMANLERILDALPAEEG